ncbi:MAG: phenylacetate-CoA oxygenase subunit PaaC [Saprospiraceae bacterium]|nr:phenylacetate-CoA oxygenase subunit PaaC [Saprospiraceae bacterium]
MSAKDLTIDYLLTLGDNALILGQRLCEWCGHAPIIEQDIALSNIALDLIGEARNIYTYAAQLAGNGQNEDTMAFLREEWQYKNLLIVEQPNGNWADTIARQFYFDAFHYSLYSQLQHSNDDTIAAIAEKSLKEITYHLRFSAEWVIRLGDGTEESSKKMQDAIDRLWVYTGEMFIPSEIELKAAQAGIGIDPSTLLQEWNSRVIDVLLEATLKVPTSIPYQKGGKVGNHSEHMGYILSDMQYMQRTYPHLEW